MWRYDETETDRDKDNDDSLRAVLLAVVVLPLHGRLGALTER